MSFGAQFSQAAAYSFGGIDALILMGYAEPPHPTPEGALLLADAASPCATGGQRKRDSSGPPGYTLVPPDRAPAVMFNDPDPRAAQEWTRLVESDPCGIWSSGPARIQADAEHLDEITVPVLLAYGDHDEIFGQPGPRLQEQRFTGTPDRTLMLFPGAGHVFFLETQRATWIAMIADWLQQRGL